MSDQHYETQSFHGSDLDLIEKQYGIPKEQIINFSANINPLGISPMFKQHLQTHILQIESYPERDYTSLRSAIANYCQVPLTYILAGSGATELISRFIRFLSPKKALLIGPTYSEYERELRLAGGHLIPFYLKSTDDFRLDTNELLRTLNDSVDLLILCNPNNPTGSALNHAQLHSILSYCENRDIAVMIDETYVEFAEPKAHISAASLTAQYQCLFVLRGVSKFFAAPGLRLGYAITQNPRIIAELNGTQNPWCINSFAAGSGALMFQDQDYIRKTQSFISAERTRIVPRLKQLPFLRIYDSAANFILLELLKPGLTSQTVFKQLLKQGLMIRDCSSFTGLPGAFIRFCYSTAEHNDRLLHALEDIV